MKTPIISSSAAAQSSVPSLIFRAYTVKELACLYFPQKTATGASRSLRALIRHDPELLSQLRAQGYRPRVHYLPPLCRAGTTRAFRHSGGVLRDSP